MTAIKTREIRFTIGMFDGDLTSFVGDSSNAAPASFLTLLHEAGHAQETKVLNDANSAEMAALVETNKAIIAATGRTPRRWLLATPPSSGAGITSSRPNRPRAKRW